MMNHYFTSQMKAFWSLCLISLSSFRAEGIFVYERHTSSFVCLTSTISNFSSVFLLRSPIIECCYKSLTLTLLHSGRILPLSSSGLKMTSHSTYLLKGDALPEWIGLFMSKSFLLSSRCYKCSP